MLRDCWCTRRTQAPAYLAIIVVLAASLAGCGSSVSAVPAATVASFPGIGNPPLLVDAAWLQSAMNARLDPLVVVDLSSLNDYRRGHVPGAVNAWWQDTMNLGSLVYGAVRSEGRDGQREVAFFASLGIGDTSTVVAYDSEQNRYASLLVWLLRSFGHEQAMVLDGGLAAWKGAGGEVSRTPTEPVDARIGAFAPGTGLVVGAEELLNRLDDPSLAILDARTDAEAADDLNDTLRPGRIPGAISIPWTATLRDEAGRLKSPEELTALLRDAGITPDKDVIIYTRFGVEAAQPWLVLTLLGYPHVQIYDWGWAGWGSRLDLPVA